MGNFAAYWDTATPTETPDVRFWLSTSPDGKYRVGQFQNAGGGRMFIRRMDASEDDFLLPEDFNTAPMFSFCNDRCIGTKGIEAFIIKKTAPGVWDVVTLPLPVAPEDVQGVAVASISGDGTKIVGNYSDTIGYRHALLWTNEVVQDLGVPDGFVGGDVIPRCISSNGEIIVGSAATEPGIFQAVVWTVAGGWEKLRDYALARGANVCPYDFHYGIAVSATGKHFIAQDMPSQNVIYITVGDALDPVSCGSE